METYYINIEGIDLEVTANIEEPDFSVGDSGRIEIVIVNHCDEDISELISSSTEEKIINAIRSELSWDD